MRVQIRPTIKSRLTQGSLIKSRMLSMLALLSATLLFCCTAHALLPHKVNHQGFFTSPSGAPLNGNIAIGSTAVAAEATTTRIGSGQTRAFVAGIRGVTPAVNDALPVVIDSSGQLGTAAAVAAGFTLGRSAQPPSSRWPTPPISSPVPAAPRSPCPHRPASATASKCPPSARAASPSPPMRVKASLPEPSFRMSGPLARLRKTGNQSPRRQTAASSLRWPITKGFTPRRSSPFPGPASPPQSSSTLAAACDQ